VHKQVIFPHCNAYQQSIPYTSWPKRYEANKLKMFIGIITLKVGVFRRKSSRKRIASLCVSEHPICSVASLLTPCCPELTISKQLFRKTSDVAVKQSVLLLLKIGSPWDWSKDDSFTRCSCPLWYCIVKKCHEGFST